MTAVESSDAKTPTAPGFEGVLAKVAARHPVVGLAIGIVTDGRLSSFHGHGLADIATRTPVTESTVFRIGSVTKTFTAIAIMQLVGQGLIDLDAPADDYLRAYHLVPARSADRRPTIRELLTHTSGLPQLDRPARAFRPVLGQTVRRGEPVPTLAEFYRGRLRLVAAPGTQHTYSNHGFATLGQIVHDVTGRPLAEYLAEHLFSPLGMRDTGLAGPGRTGIRPATGYTLRRGGPRAVPDQVLVTAGAGAICSTTADMARYAAALLAGGGAHARPLGPGPLAAMFAPQYRPDPRLPGVGLAFFRHDVAGHPVVGHDGLVPGFSSQILLAPHDGVGVVALTNGARGALAWLGTETRSILASILGVTDAAIRADVPHRPEVWTELCGRYAFRGSFRDAQKWFVAGAEVLVRRGVLTLRPVSPIPGARHGLPLHPADPEDPDVFDIDLTGLGLGVGRVVFSRSPGAGVSAFHADLGVALLSFDRRHRTGRDGRREAPK